MFFGSKGINVAAAQRSYQEINISVANSLPTVLSK